MQRWFYQSCNPDPLNNMTFCLYTTWVRTSCPCLCIVSKTLSLSLSLSLLIYRVDFLNAILMPPPLSPHPRINENISSSVANEQRQSAATAPPQQASALGHAFPEQERCHSEGDRRALCTAWCMVIRQGRFFFLPYPKTADIKQSCGGFFSGERLKKPKQWPFK